MGATSVNTGYLWFDQAALVPSYDADGNLLSDGRWTYTWDAENRMTKMVTTTAATDAGHPYTKLEFKYDFLGRRTERAIWYKGTASSPTFKSRARWMYVGWNPVIEFSSNAGGTSLTRKLEFTWGSDLSGSMEGAGGVGGLLMQRTVSDGKLRRPAYDGNGNITAWALKGSGGTANPNMEQLRTEYDAFGNIVVSEGILNSEFGFSTKIRDPYTGLSYYGYRYYDPVTGRWPSRDPIGERGGVNLYGFVQNDGVNWADYLGLKIKRKCDFTIAVGHGAEPPDDDGPANNYVDSVLRGAECGDRVGAVSCYNGHINDAIPEDKRLPNIPERRKGKGDPHDGMFRFSDLIEAGIKAVEAAEKQAPEDCKDPETCCSKIEIDVNCLPGGRDDVNRWLTGQHGNFGDELVKRGKALCNYSNTYNCKSGKWSGKLIGEQLSGK